MILADSSKTTARYFGKGTGPGFTAKEKKKRREAETPGAEAHPGQVRGRGGGAGRGREEPVAAGGPGVLPPAGARRSESISPGHGSEALHSHPLPRRPKHSGVAGVTLCSRDTV